MTAVRTKSRLGPARSWVTGTVLLTALACSRTEERALPGDDVVVAKVNDAPISLFDLERTLDKTLGKYAVDRVERRARKNVLESMIESRALADLSEKELDAEQRALIDKEVAAYRESLLVKQYLAKHAPPKPLTPEMRRKYYEDHPERFGATEVKTYEILGSKGELDGQDRISVMKELQTAAQETDWKQAIAERQAAGQAVIYARGDLGETTLHPKLREMLSALDVGTKSSLVFIQGRAYVGRVVGTRKKDPRPFASVQEEIDRQLTPVQLRDALEGVGQAAKDKAKVERFEDALSPETLQKVARAQRSEDRLAESSSRPQQRKEGGDDR